MYVIFEMLSDLEAKKLCTSNFVIEEMKSQTIISNKQNFQEKAFWIGFMHLKIKI